MSMSKEQGSPVRTGQNSPIMQGTPAGRRGSTSSQLLSPPPLSPNVSPIEKDQTIKSVRFSTLKSTTFSPSPPFDTGRSSFAEGSPSGTPGTPTFRYTCDSVRQTCMAPSINMYFGQPVFQTPGTYNINFNMTTRVDANWSFVDPNGRSAMGASTQWASSSASPNQRHQED